MADSPPEQDSEAGRQGQDMGEAEILRSATRAAEWNGSRLALYAKGFIIAVMAVYLPLTFDPPGLYWPLAFVALFIVTGIVQAAAAPSDPRWIVAHIGAIVVDSVALAVVIAVPNPLSGLDLPEQMPFRTSYFALLIIYVVSVGYAYRPVIAFAAGLSCAVAWAVLSLRVAALPETVGWSALPAENLTSDDLALLFGDPHFFSGTARNIEVTVIVLAALLVAGLVWRSRLQIGRVLKAERDREKARAERSTIHQTFGRYVPKAVAEAILSDRGRLQPQQKRATVLFVDIAEFTRLSEELEADTLLEVLNAFFDAAEQEISAYGGVINQFQGDALLASFNIPVADPDHPRNAVLAAEGLIRRVREERFGGEQLTVRVGLHTGDLVAGTVGGGDRLSYTVLGHTVNIAARLEQLNKDKGTTVLLSETTANASGFADRLVDVGTVQLRGATNAVQVFTLKSSP